MKIMMVSTFYYPDMVGGTERSLQLLCESLARNGNDVAVFCLSGNERQRFDVVRGVQVYYSSGGNFRVSIKLNEHAPKRKKLRNKLIELNNLGVRSEFCRALDHFAPDIVHTNNLNGLSSVIWKIAKQRNLPVVHTVRDYWLLSPKYNLLYQTQKWRGWLCRNVYQNIQKRYSSAIRIVTGASDFIIREFSSEAFFHNPKIRVIHNSIEIEDRLLEDSLVRRINRSGEIHFLFAGHLSPDKGIMTLLEAVQKCDRSLRMDLTVCGDGPLMADVLVAAERDGRIHCAGKLSRDEMAREYEKADVLIVPSIWAEPFGRVIIEAYACGCTVIGTEAGGIPEIIRIASVGQIVPASDADALSGAIAVYCDRTRIIDDIGRIREIIHLFDQGIQTAAFESVYREALEK